MPKHNPVVFQINSGKLTPNTKASFDGLRIGTDLTTYVATGDTATGNFYSATKGVQISYVNGSWLNNTTLSADQITAGYSDSTWNYGGATNSHNGVLTHSNLTGMQSTTPGAWVIMDLGSEQDFNTVKFFGANSAWSPSLTVNVYQAPNNGGAPGIFTLAKNITVPMVAIDWVSVPLGITAHGRFVKFEVASILTAGKDGYGWSQLSVNTSSYVNTLNTVDAIIPNTVAASFAPPTLVIYDGSSIAISNDAALSLQYSVNAGSTWIGSDGTSNTTMTMSQFKALSPSLFTSVGVGQFRLRVKPVGAQTIKSISIENTSSAAVLSTSGAVESVVAGAVSQVGVEIVGSATDATALESAHPTVTNSGKWALIQGVLPQDEDGFYQSNGTVWVKRLDDSDFKIGDRTALFDFSGGITYSAVNSIALGSGSTQILNASDADVTLGGAGMAGVFDGNLWASDSDAMYTQGNAVLPVKIVKNLVTPIALGKFVIDLSARTIALDRAPRVFKVQGKDVSNVWNDLSFTSAVNATTSDNIIFTKSNSTNGAPMVVTLTGINATPYYAYRLYVTATSGGTANYLEMSDFGGYATIDTSSTINCVGSINKLYNKIGAASGIAPLDGSGKVPSANLPSSLALGTTSTTAFQGDLGQTAYSHSQATGNPHGLTATTLNLGNVTNESKSTMFTSPTFTGTPVFPSAVKRNIKDTRTITATGNVLNTDELLRVNGSAAVVLTMPDLSTCVDGQVITIKDIATAGTYNITINDYSGQTTDPSVGQTTNFIMTSDKDSVTFAANTATNNWEFIS